MNNRKTVKLQLRLSEDELQVFKKKSESYGGNISGMVRDAVSRFDDKKAKGKMDLMTVILKFYKEYQQRLSWLGGNINQAQHRANELAIVGELPADYFYNVLMPKTQEATQLIKNLKFALEVIQENIEEP